MTNYEKYKDELIKKAIIKTPIAMDIHTDKIVDCQDITCEDCKFDISNNECGMKEWLDSEYVESKKEEVDWSKIPIDTKVLVSSDGVTWYKRYFAGVLCKTGCPQVFANGADNWSNSLTESWKYIKLYEEDKE